MRIGLAIAVSAVVAIVLLLWQGTPEDVAPARGAAAAPTSSTPSRQQDPDAAAPDRRALPAADTPAVAHGADPEERIPDGAFVVLVRGRVLAAGTGAPIADALVTARVVTTATARTDADGRYELRVPLRETSETLLATHDHWLPATGELHRHRVRDGAAVVDLELQPRSAGATITGRVRSAVDGTPVADVELWLGRSRFGIHERHDWLPSTHSDDEGTFVLAPVPPGRVDLFALSKRHDDYRIDSLEVLAGARLELDVVLEPFSFATVAGVVVRTDRTPVEGARVHVRSPQSTRWSPGTTTGADGRFELARVSPGPGELTVRSRDGNEVVRELVLAAGSHTDERVVLPGGPHFVGGVLLVGDEPGAGYEVDCTVPEALAKALGYHWTNRVTRTAADGSFRIDDLPGGPVELTFMLRHPHTFLQQEDVATGRDDHRFVFPRAVTWITVHGTVRDVRGAPLAGVAVAPIRPDGPESFATTGVAGGYRLRMRVTRDATFGILAEKAGYASRHVHVTRSDADATLEVERDIQLFSMNEFGRMEFTVVDTDGRPVAGADCRLFGDGNLPSQSGRTDSTGRILLQQVAPGKRSVLVRHPDHNEHRSEASLAPERTTPLHVVLRRQQRQDRTLEVTGAAGEAIAGADVMVWTREGLSASGRTDALGRLSCPGLPEGTIRFAVTAEGYSRQQLVHELEGPWEQPLRMELRAGLHQIEARVVGGDGAARTAVEVHCVSEPIEGVQIESILHADADGLVRFERLPPGRYRLSAYGREGDAHAEASTGGGLVTLRLQPQ